MRRIMCVVAVFCVCSLLGRGQLQESSGQSPPAIREILDQEKPFWDSAQAFINAYAEQDAEAIGNLFTADAEFRDEFGDRTVGREAITQLFAEVFESNPEAVLESIDIERVRLIGDRVALEEGWVSA